MLTDEEKDPEKSVENQAGKRLKELRAEISALKLQKALLQENCARLQQLYDQAPLAYQSLDEKGCVLSVNKAWLDILGYQWDEVIGRNFADFLHPDSQDHFSKNFPRFKTIGQILGVEFVMRRKDGGSILVAFDGRISSHPDGRFQQTHCIFRDITAHRAEEARRQAECRLLRICHQSADLRELIGKLVAFFKELTHCQAVDIRLCQGDDYDYYESGDFPPHFINTENFLCERIPEGDIARNGAGKLLLEYMCSNVLCGRTDPSHPFFTQSGSFWTNNITELLAQTIETDRKAQTRKRCNDEGYESMALIPFRLREKVYGLLQLNDKTPDRFTPKLIGQLEELAAYVSLTLSKHMADSFRQESEERYRSLFENSLDAILLTIPDGSVVAANPAACAMFGMSEEEIREAGRDGLMSSDDPRSSAAIAERKITGKLKKAELCFMRKNGERFLGEVDSVILPCERPRSFVIIQDISERKQAEETLRVNEERLRMALEGAQSGVWESNLATGEDFWDVRLARLLAVPLEEVATAQHRWLEMIHPDDLARVKAAYTAACQPDGPPYQAEFRVRRWDGTERWLLSQGVQSLSSDGSRRMSGVVQDITERKQAEETVRQRNEELTALLDTIPAYVWVAQDPGCRLITGNRAANKMTAIPDATNISQSVVAEGNAPYMRQLKADGTEYRVEELPIQRVVATGQPVRGASVEFCFPDGRRVQTIGDTMPLFDANGAVRGAVAAFFDITERKRAEEALRESETKFRTIFEKSRDAIGVSSCNKYVYSNPAFLRLFGYTSSEGLEGLPVSDFIAPRCRDRLQEMALRRSQGLEMPKLYEIQGLKRDGSEFDMEVQASTYELNGQVFTLALIRDITERKKDEEELRALNDELERRVERRTQELQEAQSRFLHVEKLSAIGKLSASIAHEFNSPLQAVMTFLKGLRLSAHMDESDLALLEMAIGESERMKGLIRNLQDFYRPSTSRKIMVNLHATIDSLLMLYKSDFYRKNIKIELHYANMLPHIMAVPDQIKQVFLNLINNATEACLNRGGDITISTWRVGNKVAVSIKDNGQGIKPSDKEQIFRPFFSTKAEVKGTGLGLSTSYGIVKSHGGEITVTSAPGEGAVFTVFLPIQGEHLED